MLAENRKQETEPCLGKDVSYIMVNRVVVNNENITKSELKKLADTENKQSNWTCSLIESVSDLSNIISQGYSIRVGIFDGKSSLKEQDVTACYYLLLDFDKSTVDTTLKVIWSKQACLWYYTPSYEPGVNEKHRLVFKLTRPVSATEYRQIYSFIRGFYKTCDNTSSPSQYFFGASVAPDSVTILGKGRKLDVDNILSVIPTFDTNGVAPYDDSVKTLKQNVIIPPTKNNKQDGIKENQKTDNITTSVLKYINTEVFLGVCNEDVNQFFKLWGHNLRSVPTDKKEQISKYSGRLYGSKNPDGSGLSVTISDTDLPPTYYDRSEDRVLNYLEYWHQHSKDVCDEKFNLKNIVNSICESFQVEPFNFRSNYGLFGAIAKFFEDLKGGLYVQGWEGERDSTRYIYFDIRINVWKKLSATNLINLYLTPRFKDEYPDYADMILDYMSKKDDGKKKKLPDIKSFIIGHLENNPPEIMDFHPEIDPRLVVLKNGIFNLETGELEENKGQAFNFNSSPDIKYFPVKDEHPVIKNLQTYFKDWLNSDIEGELLLANLILCVKRDAYKLKKIVCMQGTSNKGKSTYGALVQNVMNGSEKSRADSKVAIKMGVGSLLGNNAHEIASIEGKYLIYMDEINTLNPKIHDIERLKIFSSERKDRDLLIKPIYEKARTIKTYAAIIAVSEDNFKFQTSDGIDNRFAIVTVDNSTNMKLGKRLTELQHNLDVIHNWCLTQDSNFWEKRFIELTKSEKMRQTLIEQKRATEPLVEFIEDNFEITSNENDIVENDTIWLIFQNWSRTVSLNKQYQSKQSFGIHLSKILQESKYGFNWSQRGGKTIKGSGSRYKPRRTNIKVRDEVLQSLPTSNVGF